jgi:hypothetical protein
MKRQTSLRKSAYSLKVSSIPHGRKGIKTQARRVVFLGLIKEGSARLGTG